MTKLRADGMTATEIAAVIEGYTPASIRSIISRGRQHAKAQK
ncbi:MAG: hypothetical protein ACR2NO_08200 [Chloroflexota bacterium]